MIDFQELLKCYYNLNFSRNVGLKLFTVKTRFKNNCP